VRLRSALAPLLALVAFGASVAVAPSSLVTVTNTSLSLDAWTQPQAVALSPDGTRAYTANYYGGPPNGNDGTVSVVNTATGELLGVVNLTSNNAAGVVANFIVASHSTGIVVNHAGTRAYVATSQGKVWTLDLTGSSAAVLGEPIDVTHNLGQLGRMVISPDDATLYVTEHRSGARIAKIALATAAITESARLVDDEDVWATGFAISPDGTNLFVGFESGALKSVSTADLQVTASTNLANYHVLDIAVDTSGARLYVVGDGGCGAEDGCLAVRNAPTLTPVRMISLGTTARSVALSPDGATAYVGLTDWSVVQTPSDGSGTPGSPQYLFGGAAYPHDIAVNPDGSAIYVTSYRDAPDGCTSPIDDTSILTTCHQGALITAMFPAPGVPTDLVATPGDGSVTVAFTPGAANRTTITNTEYSVDRGAWTAASPVTTTGPVTISGLRGGQTYSVRLRMRSGSVAGPASSAVQVTTPAASPVVETPAPAATPPAASPRTQAVVPPLAPPLVPPRLVPGSGTYVTVGLVPDGATSVVQLASTGASGAGQQALARATARVRARCPITTDGTQRTYRCTTHLGNGNWTVTTRAMNGSTVVAQSVRRVRVKVRAHRAVTG